MQSPLPIDPHISHIVNLAKKQRAVVVVAPPGTGKTTRIPPAIAAAHGRTILLQPRRVAARALARRIAQERGWRIGEEIGWQIRFERRFSDRTQLLVATEGILTARLQSDPLLSDFRTVILDEFHERSIHADLSLALAKQAMLARDDLIVIVMSATIDAEPIARFIGGSVVTIDATMHPVDIRYEPYKSLPVAVRELMPSAKGDILCFLPGAREIERAAREISALDAEVLPLHGSLDVDVQERALAPSTRRKIILATNIAETSLTVEGVTDVVDSGVHKILRFDPSTAIDHLQTERIPRDSADQRAGRAGRTAPGRATRLWDERDILRPHREPEIARVDLAGPALDIIAWGGDPGTFDWFERPPQDRLEAALQLLKEIGAIAGGDQMRRFPLHPRLARVMLDAHGSDAAAEICTRLSEGAIDARHVQELRDIARRILGSQYRREVDEETLRRALLAGYPDRVAMRREPGSPRLLLASGVGATLKPDTDPGGDFLVVLEIMGDVVTMARRIEREWLTPTHTDVVHEMVKGRARTVERLWYHQIPLGEQLRAANAEEAARLLAQSVPIDETLRRRAEFAEVAVDWQTLVAHAVMGKATVADVDVARHLPFDVRKRIDKLAPEALPLPSGRSTRLDYRDDGSVLAAVKLQELFGLADTPRIGPRQTPVTFSLLAPNGRPVQTTQDLHSFWNNTYPEVRRELRARYPKHPWPEDPWNAVPTHRTKKR